MTISADPSVLPAKVRLDAITEIPSLRDDDLAQALSAFQRQANEILETGSGFSRLVAFGGRRQDWFEACRASLVSKNAAAFFADFFKPYRVHDVERPMGLFTGYYEPEVEGRMQRSQAFSVPLYRRPPDLVAFNDREQQQTGLRYGRHVRGRPQPYFTRHQIETGALDGQELEICWLRSSVDAFFLQIQGSGRVSLPGGKVIRLSYAAKSGLPYTGIGGVLAQRGIIPREQMSMQSLRAWMSSHPTEARDLMRLNKSFVFFREISVNDESLGAVGAAQVNLTPRRSLAVDRSNWMFGTPVWIDTTYPPEATNADKALRRLMIAQDTGSAIRGFARGDVYWGWGDEAATIAGHMKSPGTMTVLLPHAVARTLGLP